MRKIKIPRNVKSSLILGLSVNLKNYNFHFYKSHDCKFQFYQFHFYKPHDYKFQFCKFHFYKPHDYKFQFYKFHGKSTGALSALSRADFIT